MLLHRYYNILLLVLRLYFIYVKTIRTIRGSHLKILTENY